MDCGREAADSGPSVGFPSTASLLFEMRESTAALVWAEVRTRRTSETSSASSFAFGKVSE